MTETAGASVHRTALWDCGVPWADCKGGGLGAHQSGVNTRLGKPTVHASQDEAARCAKAHAVRYNATKGPTEAILLPSKPLRMKKGKAGRMMVPLMRG